MKRPCIQVLAFALLLLAVFPAFAESSGKSAPFTGADIEAISQGLVTVGDYAALLSPDDCAWAYQGPATGETYLTLRSAAEDGAPLGEVTLRVSLEDGLIEGLEAGESEALPEGLDDLGADLLSAKWQRADYPLPAIRGVQTGAAQADVVAAFFTRSAGVADYTVQDINPAVDETWYRNETWPVGGFTLATGNADGIEAFLYGWCTLDEPDQWREYRSLFYHMDDGVVSAIDLAYSTDPE